MKNWEDDDDTEYCSSRQTSSTPTAAADVIGIDIEAVNFAKEYKERVFADFLREYSAGRTPNPDVLCNAEIKFRAFLDHAMTMGPTGSRRATMRACAAPKRAYSSFAAPTRTRTRATSCIVSRRNRSRACYFP